MPYVVIAFYRELLVEDLNHIRYEYGPKNGNFK